MSDFFQWLAGGSTSSMVFIIAFALVLIGIFLIYTVAFLQGREISFWPLKIGQRPERNSLISKPGNFLVSSAGQRNPRVSFMCSTTPEIEKSPEKKVALQIFYQTIISEIERTPICINTGGSEPLRSVILDNYASKLKTHSKPQLESLNNKVRWYWYVGDTSGFGFEPPVYESRQTNNAIERPIKEALESNIIIALTGQTGTREQIERLIQYHNQKQYGIDLNRRPLIVLSWLGGSTKEFINENLVELNWLLDKYPELEPKKEIKDWHQGDNPQKLARRLVHELQKFLAEK